MRARRIALILTSLLASTSAIGIVLWKSHQASAGSLAVAGPVADTNADIISGAEAIVDPSAMALQYDEFLSAALPFEQAPNGLGLPGSDSVTPELNPLSIDMEFAHVQRSAELGTSGAATTLPTASVLAAAGAMHWTGAVGRGGGGGRARNGNGSNPQPPAPDNTGPAGEQEQPGGRDPHQGGGSNGDRGSESPTEPTGPTGPTWPNEPTTPVDHLPTPVDPVVKPPVSAPEPGTLGLVLMGAAGAMFGRRKRRVSNAQ